VVASDRRILIDVSRLIWRSWRGNRPTGVDRVCRAYVQRFHTQSLAVVQRGGRHWVLNSKYSELLFELFTSGLNNFRSRFLRLSASAFSTARQRPPRDRMLYLNIGHTGLDEPSLPKWIARNRLRAVYLVHDLIPLLHPEYCRPGEEAKHRLRMENVLKSAHGLIGNSQATIDDLAFFAAANGLPMPPAVAAWIAGSQIPTSVTAKSFDRPHFITVGTIEGRKNHSLLLHIWKRLVRQYGLDAPLLVIVGQRGWEASHALAMLDRAVDLKDHVMELGDCGDVELASLIAGARALLMPSFAEGFGMPVAEALQLGTPVIATDLPVYREFAGTIPTYLDAIDGAGWMSAIVDFTGDSLERKRQLQAMQGYTVPDWKSHFDKVQEWLAAIDGGIDPS
jgi:glycosyltransferase involved in cell wall biosynthesis